MDTGENAAVGATAFTQNDIESHIGKSVVPPLCVDLDGTLIGTDCLYESLVSVATTTPQCIPTLLLAAAGGRARLKAIVAHLYVFEPKHLPYRQEVLDLIESRRRCGIPCFLVTASAMSIAKRVAEHLGCFESVYASSDHENLKGRIKAALLESRFGVGGFDYVGDSRADIPCWTIAASGFTVTPGVVPPALASKVTSLAKAKHMSSFTAWLRALRIHQWAKNLIVFLPVLTSHSAGKPELVSKACLAFAAFCMAASAVYLLNDICDIPNDRAHEHKKNRPIASGVIGIPQALAAAAVLLASATGVAFCLPIMFLVVLIAYLVLTTAYSLLLKKILMLDVIVLATLYILRMFGGHAATGVAHSVWLTTFALFMFYSLALLKRATELRDADATSPLVAGRGYMAADLPGVEALGVGAGLLSVLVIALYVRSPDVVGLYRNSALLLLICPVILYWVGRLWILERRGVIHHDPIVFALRDTISHLVGIVIASIVVLATLWP